MFSTPAALGFPDVPRGVRRSRDPNDVDERFYTAGMLNLERSSLAILERELALHGRRVKMY